MSDQKFIYIQYYREIKTNECINKMIEIPQSFTVGELKEYLEKKNIFNPLEEILQTSNEIIMNNEYDAFRVTEYMKEINIPNSLFITKCIRYNK